MSDSSPHPHARITGVVYFLYFLTTVLGSVLASRGLTVVGSTLNLISDAFYIAVTVLFYYLFKPVNRNLSLIAALFSLAGCTVTVLDAFSLAPASLSPLIFFGPYCILLGYLIFRSTFLPRTIGVLLMLAGVGWLVFLSPLVAFLSTYIKVVGIAAEGSLMLWLIVMGVNVQRWMEQAAYRL